MQEDKLLLDIIARCTDVKTPDEFNEILNGAVKQALGHEIMVCGIGGLTSDGNFVHKFINNGYPLEYYYSMLQPNGMVDSPLSRMWRNTQKPVLFQSGRDDHLFPSDWVELFNRYDLRNTIGHGVLDLKGPFSSYFIFSRIPNEIGPREATVLSFITPHLHYALARVESAIPEHKETSDKSKKQLSDRQLEILSWINDGKSNWAISKILNTTEANVKYHVDQIFQKLNVRTRAQAVARAKDMGLLSTPR